MNLLRGMLSSINSSNRSRLFLGNPCNSFRFKSLSRSGNLSPGKTSPNCCVMTFKLLHKRLWTIHPIIIKSVILSPNLVKVHLHSEFSRKKGFKFLPGSNATLPLSCVNHNGQITIHARLCYIEPRAGIICTLFHSFGKTFVSVLMMKLNVATLLTLEL